MNTPQKIPYTIYSLGNSRSRIVIVAPTNPTEVLHQIPGTRWLVPPSEFSALQKAIANISYPNLDIPGSITSGTWQRICTAHNLIAPDTREPLSNLIAYNYGEGNTRIVLIDCTDRSAEPLLPQRVGSTSFIAATPTASRRFKNILRVIPGGKAAATGILFDLIPGGAQGETISRLRQSTR